MPFTMYPWNLIFVGLILLPNVLSIFYPPRNLPAESQKPGGWNGIILMERLGQVSLFVLPLFWEAQWQGWLQTAVLIGLIVSLALYYCGWLRYFFGGREFSLLFQPMLRIPVPMAVSPILYFLFLGILLESWPILLAAVIFAAGHIPESLRNVGK